MEALKTEFALVGVAGRALPGEPISGDSYVVAPIQAGILVAVIDGLGHGNEAALASKAAVESILTCASENLISVVKRCHDQLRGTRGAVMSIASFSALDGTMTWMAVGNVEAYLLRASLQTTDRPYVLMRGGVVGHSLPTLRCETIAVSPGDTLIVATDGIRAGFSRGLSASAPPQEMADAILEKFARDTDDALVLAVRWFGQCK